MDRRIVSVVTVGTVVTEATDHRAILWYHKVYSDTNNVDPKPVRCY